MVEEGRPGTGTGGAPDGAVREAKERPVRLYDLVPKFERFVANGVEYVHVPKERFPRGYGGVPKDFLKLKESVKDAYLEMYDLEERYSQHVGWIETDGDGTVRMRCKRGIEVQTWNLRMGVSAGGHRRW